MNLPTFTAEASLYRTTKNYQIADALPFVRGVFLKLLDDAIPFVQEVILKHLSTPKTCDEGQLETDRQVALTDLQGCQSRCTRVPFKSCYQRCDTAFRNNIQDAIDIWGCPRGTVCTSDVQSNLHYCCPSGTAAACTPPKQLNAPRCQCECPSIPCAAPKIINQNTCQCECPSFPCSGIKVRDPNTCQCICPAPLKDCNGICVDSLKSKTNCGFCGNSCKQGEDCCNGLCKPLDTCSDCGFCGNSCDLALGEGCCNRVRKKLNTVLNCGIGDSGCGTKCDPGESCEKGFCICPSPRVKCGSICCPTNEKGCCDGGCTNTKTDLEHCGGCNQPCPNGASCVNGVCQCPANHIVCGVLGPGFCRDNMTPPPGSGWVAWRALNPGTPLLISCVPFICHPTLVKISDQNGNEWCCPPGTTNIVNGRCFVPL
jgi:hypothetical protein